MKLNKIILFFVIFIAVIGMYNYSNAASLELNNLEINATLNENGSMKVTEKWTIDIENTNTLFKTFNLDREKYSGISNVSVTEIGNAGEKSDFSKINEQMYHVTKNSFYALPIGNNKFEIAWGVDVKNKIKTYEITYTVNDVINEYNDCYELYWQFIGSDFEIPIKNFTGTITLPNKVENIDNLRVWAHGPLTGNIERTSTNTVKFSVAQVNPNTFIEIRMAVLEKGMFNVIPSRVENTQKFNSIVEEETNWADKANAVREYNTKQEQTYRNIYYAIAVLLSIFIIFKIIKANKKKREVKENKIEATQKLDYFRDIPDEKASPAEAQFLHYYRKTDVNANSKIISSTMLNLCLKGMLSFDVDQTKKKDNIIVEVKEKDSKNLTEDEKILYEMLKEVPKEGNSFSMKEFEKYIQKHSTSFIKDIDKMKEVAKKNQEAKGNYDLSIRKEAEKFSGVFAMYLVLGAVGMFFMGIPGILAIVCAIINYNIYKMLNTLTQKGEDEKEQWIALGKYMEDFSLIKEREVPELALWEKYLVYATVFGIAEKVIKQLKVVYPEIGTDANYSYMPMLYNAYLTTNLIDSINKSVTNAYTNANATYYNSSASSGGGFGGGFSGGGGFGGGGGRWRRKISSL